MADRSYNILSFRPSEFKPFKQERNAKINAFSCYADTLSAARFYEQLFGWQIEKHGQYAIVRNGDKAIAGSRRVVTI